MNRRRRLFFNSMVTAEGRRRKNEVEVIQLQPTKTPRHSDGPVSFLFLTFVSLLCANLTEAPLGAAPSLPQCETPQVVSGSPPKNAAPSATRSLRVVSLNVHGENDWEVIHRELEASPDLAGADVFLLQEVKEDGARLLAAASEALDFYFLFAPSQDWGLAMLSRFPLRNERAQLLPQNDLKYNNRCRIALLASAETDFGTLNLINVHLDTRINTARRIRQVRPVLEAARKAGGSTLIAGDFNTADVLWIKSVIPIPFLQSPARALRKTMEKEGFATPFLKTGATFGFPPMKLDWIFLKGLRPRSQGLVGLPFTDHKALWTVIE